MVINKNSGIIIDSFVQYTITDAIDVCEDITIDLDRKVVFLHGIKTTGKISSNQSILSSDDIVANSILCHKDVVCNKLMVNGDISIIGGQLLAREIYGSKESLIEAHRIDTEFISCNIKADSISTAFIINGKIDSAIKFKSILKNGG